jgi:two-component system sensor histidine kinase/response regulator
LQNTVIALFSIGIAVTQTGLQSQQFAAAVSVLSIIVLLMILMLFLGRLIRRHHDEGNLAATTRENLVAELEQRTEELAHALLIMRGVLEATTDAILVTDEKVNVTNFNAKYIDMRKIPREVMESGVAREVQELASQNFADPQRFIARIEEIAATCKESFDLMELKDGRIFERYSKVLTTEGQGAGRVWSFRDVTEHYLAEINSRQLAAIVASSDDAIIGKNLNSIVTSWNFGAERIFGYTAKEMIGTSIMRLIPPDRQEDEQEILARIRRGERVEHFETIRLAKNGRQLYSSITVSPIKDSAGHVVGASKVVRDIRDQKRAEQELRHAKEAAEAANRVKSQFLSNMSHEIRTPMNGVIGMTGVLLDGDLAPQQREFAEIIRVCADDLLTIINDILDFSKIEAGKLSFELLDFDLIDTVESAVELLAERAHTKAIELASAMAPDLPTRLRGDPRRLRQILSNLISNALKFTEKGEVVVRVSKESETETHARVRFRVEDSGIGISPEAQGKLFQAFSQVDGSTTRKYGGTGLGLAIAKQLVTLMEGEIGVHSEPGKGSAFWFTARLEKQTDTVLVSDPWRHNLVGAHVLVVDDNVTNRLILRHQLDAWKMLVETAADGEKALEMLKAAATAGLPYHVALLDVQMPKMDGWTLARAIQTNPALTGTRLIVLTSFGQAFSPAELKATGIEAYLVKPVKQSQLFDCLVSAIGKAEAANAGSSWPHRLGL